MFRSKTILATIFYGFTCCSAPTSSEDRTKKATAIDSFYVSPYPIHRGYQQELTVTSSIENIYLSIDFDTDTHLIHHTPPQVQTYDIILSLDYNKQNRLLITSGDNQKAEIYKYPDVGDLTNMTTWPVEQMKFTEGSFQDDEAVYLLVKNRKNRYAKLFVSKQNWKCNLHNRCSVHFYFDFYYYYHPEPDLALH